MIFLWNDISRWTNWLKSVAMRTVVIGFGDGRCHIRHIRQVPTMPLTCIRALRGAPANRRISNNLSADACQERMCKRRRVCFTTPSSGLWSSLSERRRSNDVHSAGPTEVCVTATTPGALAGATRVWASPLGSGCLRSIGCSVASASSSSTAGSMAGFRIGVRAP